MRMICERSEHMLRGSGDMPPPPLKIFDEMDYFWCILRHFGRYVKANFQPTTECFFSSTKMYKKKKKKKKFITSKDLHISGGVKLA